MKNNKSKVEINFAVSLMDNLVTPTFVLNSDGLVIIWNKACQKLTGLKADDVIGTKDHWKGFYDSARPCLADLMVNKSDTLSSEIDRLYEKHSKNSSDEQALHAQNWCIMPLLKEKKYLVIDAGPIYDNEGSLIAVVESLRDLTELKETQSSLEKLSTTDSLTGLANRRYFDLQLDVLWFNTLRHKQALSVLVIDIDYFKNYNDFYGHQRGDECLQKVAHIIQKSASRSLDITFRYGGEEFCILLPDTDAKNASVIAKKIINSLKESAIEHNKSPVSEFITVSVGISSCIPKEADDPKSLFKTADKALYLAKNSGRSQFVVA